MKIKKLLTLLFVMILMSSCLDNKTTKTTSTNTNNSTTTGYNCYQNPSACSSTGNTTGSTTGSSTGATTGSTNGSTNTNPPSDAYAPIDNNWTSLYLYTEGTQKSFSCSVPTGDGYDLRRGTITIAGRGTIYIPGGDLTFYERTRQTFYGDTSLENYSENISPFLATVDRAKLFYDSDAKLKVRFKIKEQPLPRAGETWCYNRQTGTYRDRWGYRKLIFNVGVVKLKADGTLNRDSNGAPIIEQSFFNIKGDVGSCTTPIDLSSIRKRLTDGLVLMIYDVRSDQACTYAEGCTGEAYLTPGACWQMDIEASVDGTKNI